MQYVEYLKIRKPSIYCREIKEELIKNNVCNAENVPSRRTINTILQNLNMSKKRLTQIPAATVVDGFQVRVNEFITEMLHFNPEQMHFFDEASVIRTAGNRTYGHAPIGERAIEVQRYASNATYTLNMCCGYFGINYYDILEGPSNALEMFHFFEQALEQNNDLDLPVFKRGDCVVMDNCGFHHHRQVEPMLHDLLQQKGLHLIFQPPYSPEYNVAELVFRLMRDGLRENSVLTYDFTEIAIVRSLQQIPGYTFKHLLRKCGYV